MPKTAQYCSFENMPLYEIGAYENTTCQKVNSFFEESKRSGKGNIFG